MVSKTEESSSSKNKNFVCPLCKKHKEYSVKISVEFPNPLMKKYPQVVMEPYTCEFEYCHICVYDIFKDSYPDMHEDLAGLIELDDMDIQDAQKHGKFICTECGTKMDDAHDFSCATKESLK